MEEEIYLIDGPLAGQSGVYGKRFVGPLFSSRLLPNGNWHYYALCTKGKSSIPEHYQYLGSSCSEYFTVDEAREALATEAAA